MNGSALRPHPWQDLLGATPLARVYRPLPSFPGEGEKAESKEIEFAEGFCELDETD